MIIEADTYNLMSNDVSRGHSGAMLCGTALYCPVISVGLSVKEGIGAVETTAEGLVGSTELGFGPMTCGKTIRVKKFMKMKMPTVFMMELKIYTAKVEHRSAPICHDQWLTLELVPSSAAAARAAAGAAGAGMVISV